MPESQTVYKPQYKTGFYGGKFMPFHTGHLNCVLRAASQCEKLYVVLMHHGQEECEFFNNPEDEDRQTPCFPKHYLTPHIRELAIRHELKPFGNIEVLAYDCRDANIRAAQEGKHPWYYECQDMVKLMGHFDAAYSSEPEYSKNFEQFYPWTTAVLLDPGREDLKVSGTMLRGMPLSEAYRYLPRSYQCLLNKSVLVTGTESCGKTTLVRKLAALFSTSYTQEYGRLFTEAYNVSSPGIEFYNEFLHNQKAQETRARKTANQVYFCDTDAVVTNYYARLYEQSDLPLARLMAQDSSYGLVLYVEPNVAWVDDGYRSFGSPEQRARNNELLKSMYKEAGVELCVLSGNYEQNYLEAVRLVRDLLDQ